MRACGNIKIQARKKMRAEDLPREQHKMQSGLNLQAISTCMCKIQISYCKLFYTEYKRVFYDKNCWSVQLVGQESSKTFLNFNDYYCQNDDNTNGNFKTNFVRPRLGPFLCQKS